MSGLIYVGLTFLIEHPGVEGDQGDFGESLYEV